MRKKLVNDLESKLSKRVKVKNEILHLKSRSLEIESTLKDLKLTIEQEKLLALENSKIKLELENTYENTVAAVAKSKKDYAQLKSQSSMTSRERKIKEEEISVLAEEFEKVHLLTKQMKNDISVDHISLQNEKKIFAAEKVKIVESIQNKKIILVRMEARKKSMLQERKNLKVSYAQAQAQSTKLSQENELITQEKFKIESDIKVMNSSIEQLAHKV